MLYSCACGVFVVELKFFIILYEKGNNCILFDFCLYNIFKLPIFK